MKDRQVKSLRPFLGAADFEISRRFYRELGFEEGAVGPDLCYYRIAPGNGFYLQRYHVKDWVENSMVFLEVEQLESWWRMVSDLDLPTRFEGVQLSSIVSNDWGQEFFLHDPSRILWHIGSFLIPSNTAVKSIQY